MRLGPIDLYKKLPATNCGDCGRPSCLAFATQVVGYGHEVKQCPHLEVATLQEIEQAFESQREKGVYRFFYSFGTRIKKRVLISIPRFFSTSLPRNIWTLKV